MIKEINLGGQLVKFEGTTGTGELYQIFTGRNLYKDFQDMTKGFTPEQLKALVKVNEMQQGGDKTPEEITAEIGGIVQDVNMGALTDAITMIKNMGFVMYIQANTAGETPLDKIRNIKARLNNDEYLAWLLTLENDAFNDGTLFSELIDLIGINNKSYVNSKN